MNRQHPKQSGAPHFMLLGAGLVVACGPTGWAAEARAPAEPLPVSQSWALSRYAEPPRLTQAASRGETGSQARAPGTEDKGVDPDTGPAPRVDVRVGDHGDFERVVFEWPEAIDYDVVQHAEQVTVAFGRPGQIDLSRAAGPLRWVVDAWAENGDTTASVTLRVLPNVQVRSFNLKDGRVVIDLFGATAAEPLASPAPDPEQETVQELTRALEQRDAVIEQRDAVIEQLRSRIDQLAARFERLERAVALSSGDLDRVIAGQGVAGPPPGGQAGAAPSVGASPSSVAAVEAPSGEASGETAAARSEAATPEQQAATTSQGPGPEAPGASADRETAQAETPEPGQVEVDEEAAERALDFTLVQEGALLLPVGRAEFTPSFTYTRRTADFPVVLGPPGDQVVAEQDVRRNEFEFFASLLVGLPFDSQLELGLPYNLVEQSDGVLGTDAQDRTGHGLGDFSVGLAKTVLRERNWWPDVVLRANWDTGTGDRSDNDVVLDGGFQELTGSVSLVKRQDPLVFVGGASYETVFEEDDIDPGDTLGFSIGTFLAASPNTSLRVVLNQSFIDELEVDGQTIDGSDQVESILSFGASAILGRNVLLDGAVGVGLTDDSPDYSVAISLPIRFGMPGL